MRYNSLLNSDGIWKSWVNDFKVLLFNLRMHMGWHRPFKASCVISKSITGLPTVKQEERHNGLIYPNDVLVKVAKTVTSLEIKKSDPIVLASFTAAQSKCPTSELSRPCYELRGQISFGSQYLYNLSIRSSLGREGKKPPEKLDTQVSVFANKKNKQT